MTISFWYRHASCALHLASADACGLYVFHFGDFQEQEGAQTIIWTASRVETQPHLFRRSLEGRSGTCGQVPREVCCST